MPSDALTRRFFYKPILHKNRQRLPLVDRSYLQREIPEQKKTSGFRFSFCIGKFHNGHMPAHSAPYHCYISMADRGTDAAALFRSEHLSELFSDRMEYLSNRYFARLTETKNGLPEAVRQNEIGNSHPRHSGDQRHKRDKKDDSSPKSIVPRFPET